MAGDPGDIVRLTWLSFQLEEGGDACHYDAVTVFDNSSAAMAHSDGLVGRYCGSQLPPSMTSTGSRMSVVFSSDESIAHEGFSVSYVLLDESSVCGGNYHTTTGVVRSPGFPDNYGRGRECTWVITVGRGQQIMLNFTVFDMENHTDCEYDHLEIRNGGHLTSPLIGRYCGNQVPSRVTSFSNQLYLHFRSDNSVSARGFEAFWDGTATGCGGVITSATGSLASPNYPMPYHHNADCQWEIRISAGSKIQFVFIDVDLEQSDDCGYDYVELYDGHPAATSASLGKFCNPGVHDIVYSTGSVMTVRFRADYSNAGRGFHARYVTGEGN